MTILFVLIPLALLCGAGAVAAFLWAVSSGQLDDLDTPALRILTDDCPDEAAAHQSPRSREKTSPASTPTGTGGRRPA